MKKRVLMLAGVVSCLLMTFSLQANDAKEFVAKKVWNGRQESEHKLDCPPGQEPTEVEQDYGPPKWECRHWAEEEE